MDKRFRQHNGRLWHFSGLGSRSDGRDQRGYILLLMLLSVALLSIWSLAVAQDIVSQIKRDREEELIHRGTQYTRAVRRFVKKFGRYPDSIAELLDTNNIRCLRRAYTDPITGKAFKVIHVGDIMHAAPIPQAALNPPSNGADLPGDPNSLPEPPVDPAQNDANTQDPFPNGQEPAAQNPAAQNVDSQDSQAVPNSQADSGGSPGPGAASAKPALSTSPNQAQLFTGGAMVGVASISEAKTIREFSKQNHYNQWRFVYTPDTDPGGLITAPAQPLLHGLPNTSGQQP